MDRRLQRTGDPTPKPIPRILRSGLTGLLVLAFLAALAWLILLGYGQDWTGFGEYINAKGETQPEKRLWDWMSLLIVPTVLAIGVYWLEQRSTQSERNATLERQREMALQAYLDQMSKLLLKEDLRGSALWCEVQRIARTRTLGVLRRLDGQRKGIVLQFLQECDLVTDRRVVELTSADLSEAELSNSELCEINLNEVILSSANLASADLECAVLANARLDHADLRGADLRLANLWSADLRHADLRGADLRKAKLIGADLKGANLKDASLEGADLRSARLRGARLSKAGTERIVYDDKTVWPRGFTPPTST